MKWKTAILGIIVIFAIFTGAAWAGMAVPVSPGGGTAVTGQSCPTFSWSASEGAQSYRIEVYEQATGDIIGRDSMSLMANPVVAREIPAPALSWTPSSGECLSRGTRYVWYVRGVDAQGEGQWSGGTGFQVEAEVLSVEQQDAVKEVVREVVKGESSACVADSTASVADTGNTRTASSITPMTLPPVIDAYGDSYETVLGVNAGVSLDPGLPRYDTFIGANAGNHNTTGNHNAFLGRSAGYSNTTGNSNAFIGAYAGLYNTTGNSNAFIGADAGYSNITGYNNAFLGRSAGYDNTAGNGNVFLGYFAGYSETGSDRLYIDNCYTGGFCTQPLIYGEFDNRIVRIDGRLEMVTVATPSDIRYKKEIHALDSPLQKILKLQGVTYEWDKVKVNGAGFKDGRQIGLIAQEVEKVFPELVHTDAKGYKTLSYDKLGPVLIEAVKEQQKTISEQKAVIADLNEKLEKALEIIEQRLASLENPAKTIALK